MKAMVLAAGLGTRLGDITKDKPKCLVEVGGKTLLEHVLLRLRDAGVGEVMVNLHHFAEQVRAHVNRAVLPNVDIRFSYEPDLLDTGGGIWKVRDYFAEEQSFLVHNADIYSQIDLSHLVAVHRKQRAVASLATLTSDDERRLLFTPDDQLAGWENTKTDKRRMVVEEASLNSRGFCGVSVLSAAIFPFMDGRGECFSLIDPFLAAAEAGERVQSVSVDGSQWVDVGTPERLAELQQFLVS